MKIHKKQIKGLFFSIKTINYSPNYQLLYSLPLTNINNDNSYIIEVNIKTYINSTYFGFWRRTVALTKDSIMLITSDFDFYRNFTSTDIDIQYNNGNLNIYGRHNFTNPSSSKWEININILI